MKLIDVITLTVTAALFSAVAVANIIQPNRPTVSETEQRPLAAVPAFSVSALGDGSYFSGWSEFFSDTFLGRDTLVDIAKKMDTLMGIPYDMGDGDHFAVLRPGGDNEGDGPNKNDEDILADAFAQLGKDETADAETETEAPDTEVFETETEQIVEELILSKDALTLTPGSGAVVTASAKTSDGNSIGIAWSISDDTVATISANPDGGVDVKAVAAGTCTLTCYTDGGLSATCTVTVNEPEHSANTNPNEPDFLTGGMFIYGDAVYIPAFYGDNSANYYAQTAAYYQSLFGEDVQVSVVIAPVSAMVVDNPEVTSRINDQGVIQQKLAALMSPSVNFVDVYSEMYAHKDEYLFYKSDHHWTAKGAYYAYRAFAASRGFTPTELSDFEYRVISDHYNGSIYSLTKDDRVKEFVDTVEAWMSKKQMTMTVTYSSGASTTFDHAILPNYGNYIAFIAGDNPYTVINVPENPQDRNILVLKDSFGNAFVPFLAEHYGNIIVVDVRHTQMNVYEQLKDYGLTDILFVNNIQGAMNTAFPRRYLEAVGVTG